MSTTLTSFWQALALALDDLDVTALSGGTSTTATSSSWVNAVPGVAAGLLTGAWFYNVTKAVPYKISTYVPASGILTLMPDVSVANAGGDTVAITRLFPVRTVGIGSETNYLTITNRALGRMHYSMTVPIAISTSDRYSLAAYPSITRPEQLREIREPSPISGRSPVPSDRGWRIITGAPPYLQTDRPFLTVSGTLEVEWIRQASTLIAISGVWGESAAGLVNESDRATPTVEDWLPFALEEALTVLLARAPGRPSAEWARLLKQAQDDIARSPYRDPSEQQAPAPAPGQAA